MKVEKSEFLLLCSFIVTLGSVYDERYVNVRLNLKIGSQIMWFTDEIEPFSVYNIC